jgi:protein involved in ribonucleotide reduction
VSDTNRFIEKLDNLEKKMEQLEIDKEFFKKEYIQINEKYLKVLEMLQQTQVEMRHLQHKIKQLKELSDPTLWGVYEIEKYRELVWEVKE